MELHNRPVEDVENKFVITEDAAYIVRSPSRVEVPRSKRF